MTARPTKRAKTNPPSEDVAGLVQRIETRGGKVDYNARLSRAWCFTIYPQGAEELWHIPTFEPPMRYLVYQREACPSTGRLHFQGYVYFEKTVTRTTAQHALGYPTCFCVATRGTSQQNLEYCTKLKSAVEGKAPYEAGEFPAQGKRTDILQAAEALADTRDLKQVAKAYPDVYLKYHRGMEKYLDLTAERPMMTNVELNDWQKELFNILIRTPDSRHIIFVVDRIGNTGKTYFAQYMYLNHGAFVACGGKSERVVYNYKDETIIIFDITRSSDDSSSHTEDFIPYHTLETLKNGFIPHGMYGKDAHWRTTPAHVVVFCNYEPNQSKLSRDRFHIIRLQPPQIN